MGMWTDKLQSNFRNKLQDYHSRIQDNKLGVNGFP